MAKRKTGWPFQEGFIIEGTQEIHVFTDYRWNDGSVSRRQLVDPETYDVNLAIVRAVSLKMPDNEDQ
ncbi:hypothetical protein [Thalassovita taeanensis]|uniref:Uncharacterized protein n=1 Tax=Thalassovita taeanensis TaxID=657014 RepID=A0A1H9K5G1_9RHOB|nr:hypothetical protein [Thalassovita taeanensis]SEQ94153.1 hypothetical protein SAMN04488092_11731 [Thalassovita taeanensis]